MKTKYLEKIREWETAQAGWKIDIEIKQREIACRRLQMKRARHTIKSLRQAIKNREAA